MSLAETSVEEGSSLSSQNKAEMGTAQFVKCLQYKHEELTLNPEPTLKEKARRGGMIVPVLRGARDSELGFSS